MKSKGVKEEEEDSEGRKESLPFGGKTIERGREKRAGNMRGWEGRKGGSAR